MSVEKFALFLKERAPGITSFSAEELFTRGASDARLRLNTDPPEHLWPNILPALRALQELRARLGKPIILNSVYRSPAYNERIGGATNSEHMKFSAIDFHVATPDSGPADWKATLAAMRALGVFRGGLGAYETFVHIDGRGTNVDFDTIDVSKGMVLPTAAPPPLPRPAPSRPSPTVPPAPPRPPDPSSKTGCNPAGFFANLRRKK